MTTKEEKQGDPDDISFLRTEDYICLNCSVITQNGVNRRMALAAEAFGNKMCFLEDITLENVTPDLPACVFVLEQALSVRALQEVVHSANSANHNTLQQSGHKTLLYGHAVLLRHLQSNMYLTCLSTSTSNDKLAFDVGLQNHSNGESCWWTIHPASKQRSEGEKVRIGDDIILVSVASERYLHIYLVDNSIHRVNASFQQTLWTLLPISSGNVRIKNTGFVYGGDVLRLFHGNMDQCFTLPQPGVSEHPYSIFYETGSVCNHARSLWRLEYLRTRWYGGFMGWNAFVRLRHITSGRYLGVINGEISVIHRDKANADAITFILTPTKDDKRSTEADSDDNMGKSTIKYGDTLVYLQHVKSNCWLSYQTYETKKRGIGKIEEKKATLHEEGHMDDCFTIVRAQEEEARSALVIRKCMSLFTKFIRAMDITNDDSYAGRYWKKISLQKVLKCLEDLIDFFAQPRDDCSHEERQAKLKALRNRQDLFHEEGMISLVLETIDKYSETKSHSSKMNIPLFDGCKQQMIEDIYDQLYALLATMIKGNRNNCAQFAQGNRLDCLISGLTSQQASRGVLEVLHCVLIDSPETLNMIKERHIQGIISLLDRNGRDPKVLEVLSSLCANNGIAVRTNQNLICENLLPRKDLLLQTRLIDQIACLRPNIMVGVEQGESMYKKWYFEVEIDFIEDASVASSNNMIRPHCRIGWATTEFQPTPDGADGFNSIGVGDDVYSYGFDGYNLWFAGRNKVINAETFSGFKKGDVVGCLLDLSIPEIWFSLNGVPMKGFFREFNLNGMFYPVISVSSKLSCRFLFGDEHGRFKSGPPEGCAPIYQAMLQKQKIRIENCFSFGDVSKNIFQGPAQPLEQIAFTPNPVDTNLVQVPPFIDSVRDKLAENLHEIWAMVKIEQGWRYSEIRNDMKKFHNCLCQFEMLPREEKQYDTNLAMETLKTIFALGYQVLIDTKLEQKRLKLLKLPNSYMQINGYKPQPLDLNPIVLNTKLEELVDLLAENTHNLWAKERIKNGWTYGVLENNVQKRHPYLLPYDKVDSAIKKVNRETSLDTIKTLLAYGYIIEPPIQDSEGSNRKRSEKTDNSHHRFSSRTFRAEKTYAITSGKWYYEVEILSTGTIRVGWTTVSSNPNVDISADANSYSFDTCFAMRWHNGSDRFGKKCQLGDIVGVMIDLQDKTICFSLNGEPLMDAVGSESAFENISLEDGYVPAFTLFSGQKIKVNFGQDVNSLKFFTNCGLQEGYEPFAVNMTRAITFWYSNEIPIFDLADDNHESLEIIRTNQDSMQCIKLVSRIFGTNKTKMEFLRLNLPVTFHDEFIPKSILREKRMNALTIYKSQLEEEVETQQIFNFDPPDIKPDIDTSLNSQQLPSVSSSSGTNKPLSSLFNKIAPKQTRAKSPFKFMSNRLSREASPMSQTAAAAPYAKQPQSSRSGKNAQAMANKAKISRSSEYGIGKSGQPMPPPPQIQAPKSHVSKSHNKNMSYDSKKIQYDENNLSPGYGMYSDTESYTNNMMESSADDLEMQAVMDYIEDYYYGVRIFPGQDPSKVYVGWTSSKFHLLSTMDKQIYNSGMLTSQCTLINTTSDGSIISSLTRKDCYMISAAELSQYIDMDAGGGGGSPTQGGGATKRIANGLLLGCIVDLSTGLISFTVNGKEVAQKFQVEPSTKLYPAVFIEPTTKEMLQFELGRIKNCLPLSAALFPSMGKHVVSKCPPRLKLQYLKPIRWSRVPNQNLKVHTLKMNNVLGWSLLCEEPVYNQAINIPEEDRWISILELNENAQLIEFYNKMILLYESVCGQSNNYVAHQVCKQIDEQQLMYCINNKYLSGSLRKGFHDILINIHLDTFVIARSMTKHEFVVPLTGRLAENTLEKHIELMQKGHFPSRDDFLSVRPTIIREEDIKNENQRVLLIPPKFNLDVLKSYVITSFFDAVRLCSSHIRDPIGGSNAYLFVPLIRLIDKLLVIDIFDEQDLNQFLGLLDPTRFNTLNFKLDEGLLQMKIEDEVKYELCKLFHSMCDYILRFRVEGLIAFSADFVANLQADQKKRYNELKESILPSALMAKKTREFRCPARDQMNALVNFKANENRLIDLHDEIKDSLGNFHSQLNRICQIKEHIEEEGGNLDAQGSKNILVKTFKVLFMSNEADLALEQEQALMAERMAAAQQQALTNKFSLLIRDTIIDWTTKSFITDSSLIREMFHLIYRQYNALGELSDCLSKTYVIAEMSIKDVGGLLQSLSTVRSLLCVQMGPCEEEIMKCYLNEIMDNKVFFQHPDLMRALCVHETVMQVMVNWLNRRQHQQDIGSEMVGGGAENAGSATMINAGGQSLVPNAMGPSPTEDAAKEENTELVVVCCKFLSYFCRTSRHNQRAMFEHLSYLLDNSAMLLARPSLRGSCPLDVACSSLMDNNELSLALRESHLEKIAAYLSRCGLQTNSELFAKGYPDIGWDPVEGERFLDFLKFCVWVNGDSVEENANLIVRLLIRRPECLGPALRGEGGGLLKATIDGIRMSFQIAATQNINNPIVMSAMLDAESELKIDFMNDHKFDFTRIPSEEDEDYIDTGGAILAFYASLVELLGRCAPSEETIKMGKSDSIRARSILRSLVSMEDLEGVLAIRFILPIPLQPALSEHLPGVQPSHKMSIVLFLERVYGIPNQETFFRLLETGFLPDIRCATILDSSQIAECDMALAVNRYLCGSVLPLITSYAHFFDASEQKNSLMESCLNTVYRLTKCKSMTTGQLDIVCDFLIAFTNQMKPPMMKNLLRKLVIDLPTLEEYTIVPLKMLTLWYERVGKYYGANPVGLQASEEEKRLTMTLFTRIFDALAKRTYDPELFSKALPCLSAIGCALSPDYSYIQSALQPDGMNQWQGNNMQMMNNFGDNRSFGGYNNGMGGMGNEEMFMGDAAKYFRTPFDPQPVNTIQIILTPDFEEIIRNYSEHVHDFWCYTKFEEGWSYSDTYNDLNKTHPLLKPYGNLQRKDQQKYEDLTRETLKAIKALGWTLERGDLSTSNASKNITRLTQKNRKEGATGGFYPKPFDLSNITITRELDELSQLMAMNCHQIWARRKKFDLENIGAGLHDQLVPYDLLTDLEKEKDLRFSNELIKFLQLNGYRMQRIPTEDQEKNPLDSNNEIKFAFNLLEKLLEYVDKAAVNMQSIRESAQFSRKNSFRTSGQDVKFFTKVVLPLIERYFQAHRAYFILKTSTMKQGASGVASAKEKEMTCSLFCKLALLIRKKLACFGSDINIAVRCLQVLIRAVDVSSVMKNSQEIVRASLLPFFTYAADDLNNLIQDLQANRLANVKGTSQKTNAYMDYIHMVLLPVLASMFEHLSANKYGTDVLVGEIQLASYKILNSLWILGTTGTKLADREWIIHELDRHRPLIGECLGSFSASFPIAYLESKFNLNNKYSIMFGLSGSNLSEHSLEGQDVMNRLSKNLPTLEDIITEIGSLCDRGGKYEEAPHIIDVLLPTVCSYLNYWWHHGPSAKQQKDFQKSMAKLDKTGQKAIDDKSKQPVQLTITDADGVTDKIDGGQLTNVTSEMMNQLLGYILKLIKNNIEEKNATWMNRLASFSQAIVFNSTPDLLQEHFLPVSVKICEIVRELHYREINIKSYTRNFDSADRETVESDLQRDFEILIRNIYAFYPLLIKYVDLHRAGWLKNPDEQSERLYYNIAEVFCIWLKSKMFKREEVNFVSSNEIDNMLLIMPNNVANASEDGAGGHSSLSSTIKGSSSQTKTNHKKKRSKAPVVAQAASTSAEKKFTSLIVACLKRLFQIGVNFFGGKEQELIQMAKQRFIDIKLGSAEALNTGGGKQKAIAAAASASQANSGSPDDPNNFELNSDQEALVEDFIRRYLKSSDKSASHENLNSLTEPANGAVNETIDKETYQKTKWQRVLYRKIATKHHLMANLTQEQIIQRIMDIAKVLFGLHMVEHPQAKSKGTWRKLISGQRKKAVMACFRMAPLYSIPHHRAINLFLKSYKLNWMDNELENDTDLSCLIPDLCPQNEASSSDDAAIEGGSGGEEAESAVAKPAGGGEEAKSENAAAEGEEAETANQKPDPLRQLITSFNRAATTEQAATESNLSDDTLLQIYTEIMSKSCEIVEDDDEEEGGDEGGEEDQKNSFEEEEMQKQKLLFEQGRLADRGAAEMTLLYISASKGEKSEMLEKTLQLGISLLHGGNVKVQARMLKHLKDKRDVGFFTSLAGLMANCSVLDLDTFERCIKAEQFGGISNSDSGMAGKKNLHDADFTCSLFRFLQLLCEGHNLEFQNYLRAQTGNNTTVNTIICTVDYLLRLQESIMDFYWHYSGKSTVDAAGKDNFCRAITVAKQVFNTLTEYIQGPCLGNQLTLAHSRLWDAIGGFLFIFANLQDKLSKDPHQIELLRELMTLQKDMIIMLLSMLEGNVLNGPIGKQMVDTLIENQQNVEMLLKFFDIFLKMKDLTTSEAFQEFDTNGDGWISPKEFRKAMEAQKMYSSEEIDYILLCVDTNQDGKIDFMEFTERFHNPAKDIGFNMAVLLTNLSEHMSHDARLDRLMKKASSFLSYFEPFLGRIEITGSAGRIERVYFEIKESNIEQWNKPQIKESKRQFLYDIVNEGDDKEKLEVFVNFCEDTIFEMQHAASMSLSNEEEGQQGGNKEEAQESFMRSLFNGAKNGLVFGFMLLAPSRIKSNYLALSQMRKIDIVKAIIKFNFNIVYTILATIFHLIYICFKCVHVMVTENAQAGSALPIAPAPPAYSPREYRQLALTSSISESESIDSSGSGNIKPFGLNIFDKSQQQQAPGESSESEMLLEESLDPNQIGGESPDAAAASQLQVPTTSAAAAAAEDPAASSSAAGSAPKKASINMKFVNEDADEDVIIKANVGDAAAKASSSSSNYKRILSMFARNFYKLKYIALILAFLINFLMLFYKARVLTDGMPDGGVGGDDDASDSVAVSNGDDDADNVIEVIMMDPDEYYIEHIIKVLAMTHSLVAFGIMVAYYVLKVPLVIFKREKEIARKLEFQGMWIAEQPSEDDLRSHWDKLVLSTPTYPEMYWDKFIKKKVKSKYAEQFDVQQLAKLLGINAKNDEYKFDSSKKQSKNPKEEEVANPGLFERLKSVDWRYQIWKWGVMFTDNSFLYNFWYFSFSVIGNFNYFFFACHLLDVAISIKTLTTILKSITHNGKQLLLTIMLMSVIVYGYTVVAFNFFRKFYSKEEDGEMEHNCQDLFTCFKFHLYIGIRSGGGIGDELESPVGDNMEFYRIIFDITFFFFIIVILLAIIQGLIIDAFGELRDQLEQVKESLEASCFICGIGKEYFDKLPHGFEIHTMREHNFANYMFFLMHLINKPETEYTGQETYVWQLYEQRCWEFFPAGDCFKKQHEGDTETA